MDFSAGFYRIRNNAERSVLALYGAEECDFYEERPLGPLRFYARYEGLQLVLTPSDAPLGWPNPIPNFSGSDETFHWIGPDPLTSHALLATAQMMLKRPELH